MNKCPYCNNPLLDRLNARTCGAEKCQYKQMRKKKDEWDIKNITRKRENQKKCYNKAKMARNGQILPHNPDFSIKK